MQFLLDLKHINVKKAPKSKHMHNVLHAYIVFATKFVECVEPHHSFYRVGGEVPSEQ